MSRAASMYLLTAALGLLLVGCGKSDKAYEFTDVRDSKQKTSLVPDDTTTAERLGFRSTKGGAHGGAHGGAQAPATVAFKWVTPQGWEEVKGHAMRAASWRVQGEPQTDCSLTLLPGRGGNALSNVNRWRGQMGATPLTADDVATLPRLKLVGQDAPYVNIVGRYAGMGGGAPIENARMLGVLLTMPTRALFLKFIGPSKVVEANQQAFEALVSTVHVASPPPRAPLPQPGAAHGAAVPFHWTLPATWEVRKGRGGRVVTVGPKGQANVECYLYRLGGDGGGLLLNVNRWRGQMGQAPMTEAEVAKLERIDVLGAKAALVKFKGAYVGMGGQAVKDALFYGMVCLKDGYLLTGKMTGPADTMAKEWDNFVAFCKSVRQ